MVRAPCRPTSRYTLLPQVSLSTVQQDRSLDVIILQARMAYTSRREHDLRVLRRKKDIVQRKTEAKKELMSMDGTT